MGLHRTQQFILAQLSEKDALRYSDMRPASMEATQFLYHLRKLINDGLVEKQADGRYALTAQGKLYIDRADQDNLNLRAQPRLGAMLICRHPEKGLLYVRRSVHPVKGYIGFPIIDIPLGFPLPLVDFVADAAERKLGLKLTCKHRGDAYVNVERGDELEGSLLAHVMTADISIFPPDLPDDCCWEEDLTPTAQGLRLASNDAILERLAASQDFFFLEYTFRVD
ncbi:MAG TPA: hypothetical protein VG992_01775 [Candidatus Saccharimonadales bacterium]|nr:hypothetical protein [Candidatus Saccharimonadales bacterium]